MDDVRAWPEYPSYWGGWCKSLARVSQWPTPHVADWWPAGGHDRLVPSGCHLVLCNVVEGGGGASLYYLLLPWHYPSGQTWTPTFPRICVKPKSISFKIDTPKPWRASYGVSSVSSMLDLISAFQLKPQSHYKPICLLQTTHNRHPIAYMLTHWGRDKMAAISQMTLSSAFSWKKMAEFHLKFHWSLFIRVQLTISQHWFR